MRRRCLEMTTTTTYYSAYALPDRRLFLIFLLFHPNSVLPCFKKQTLQHRRKGKSSSPMRWLDRPPSHWAGVLLWPTEAEQDIAPFRA